MRYERPDYSEVRRWALQQNGAVKATDIQRQFRVGWNWACSMLEELVRDRIIRQVDNGYYVLEPRIAREPSLGSALVEAIRKAEEGPETYLSWRMEQVQQNRQAMRETERQGKSVAGPACRAPQTSRASGRALSVAPQPRRARTAKGNVIRANRIAASLWPEEPPKEPPRGS